MDNYDNHTSEEEHTFEELNAFPEYTTFDNDFLTTSPCNLDEIIDNVHAQRSSSETDTAGSDLSDNEDEPSSTISVSQDFLNISQLKQLFSSFENVEEKLTLLHRAENFLH